MKSKQNQTLGCHKNHAALFHVVGKTQNKSYLKSWKWTEEIQLFSVPRPNPIAEVDTPVITFNDPFTL